MIVLASFEDGLLTHVGDGRKGASAGTGLVRLNMMSLEDLERPISFDTVTDAVSPKFRARLRQIVEVGGLLPPKTMSAVVEALSGLDPDLGRRLERLSASRARLIATLSPTERENLALQKETLSTALQIAGVDTRQVLDWNPATVARTSFLDGLQGAVAREDVMLHADLTSLPGFNAIREVPHIAARVFAAADDPNVRVTVIMANRLPLEQQTGADLIYFNETYRAFVLVQYKALEKNNGGDLEFRWTDSDQFTAEMQRMDALLDELAKIEPDADPDGFRFSHNPFFLKFCSRIVFNPDDKGMFPGLYLPQGLWKALAASERLKGPRGGNLLTYDNVGRKLNLTEFTNLVAGAWVGTTITQSASLDAVIRSVLESGRTVTFAVKRSPPPTPAPVTEPLPIIDAGETLDPAEVLVEILNEGD